jgi:hypothetical protein
MRGPASSVGSMRREKFAPNILTGPFRATEHQNLSGIWGACARAHMRVRAREKGAASPAKSLLSGQAIPLRICTLGGGTVGALLLFVVALRSREERAPFRGL